MKNALLRALTLFVVVCMIVVSTPQMPAYAAAATPINATIPISQGGETSDCAGGSISFLLTGNVIIRGSVNDNVVNIKEGVAVTITGVNQDGVKYVGSETATINEHLAAGETVTENVNVHLNGQGSAPNVTAKLLLHITVNANGSVTADVENVSGCID